MNPRMMCVGHVALDMMFGVQAFPAHPTKTPAHHHHQGVGGMSANAAVALARLGANVAFCGPVGDDAAADVFARHFQREGVDASRMQRLSGYSSSVSAIIIDSHGERMIFNHRGSALTAQAAFDPAWLNGCQALWVDPRCPAWALQALQWARSHGVPSMLDGDISPVQDLTTLVPWADWVVFSEAGLIHAYGVGGEAGLDLALQSDAHGRAPLAVAQTLGSQGVCWKRAGQPLQHQPAWPVGPVVDTLGAGDVFHAALGLALWEGMGDATAMRWASAAAALKCLQPQGILGAPTRAVVMAFLAQVGAPLSG
jgi:sulfofructose kinase